METETKNKFHFFKIRKKTIIIFLVTFFITAVLLVAPYAWFSASLNVKVKEFNMIVSKNSGLTISFDAINFDNAVEISTRDKQIDKQKTPVDDTIAEVERIIKKLTDDIYSQVK